MMFEGPGITASNDFGRLDANLNFKFMNLSRDVLFFGFGFSSWKVVRLWLTTEDFGLERERVFMF